MPRVAQAIATSPAGLSGPFVVGGVVAVCGVGLAITKLYSPAEIEMLRKFSPAAAARDRWHRLRQTYLPGASSEAGRMADDERWPTIIITASIAGLGALLNATPAVLLALGPMARVGLGTEAFGVVLMFMGLCGLITQLAFFKPLNSRVGLYTTGAVGGVCSAISAISFLCIGTLSPCTSSSLTAAAAPTVAPTAASTACAVADASLIDVACLALGSFCFACGFMLCNACVSPVLVQSATPRTTGKVGSPTWLTHHLPSRARRAVA